MKVSGTVLGPPPLLSISRFLPDQQFHNFGLAISPHACQRVEDYNTDQKRKKKMSKRWIPMYTDPFGGWNAQGILLHLKAACLTHLRHVHQVRLVLRLALCLATEAPVEVMLTARQHKVTACVR